MTTRKWYRGFRKFHSILDDFQALPLYRVTRNGVGKMRGRRGGMTIVVAATIRPATVVGWGWPRHIVVFASKGGRVIPLRGRGVPISGLGSSAAFNCVSISSRESAPRRLFNWGRSRWSSRLKPLVKSDMYIEIVRDEGWKLLLIELA